MTAPAIDLARLEAAHERLAEDVRRLDEDALRRPSLLPGWSRAHVLVHIANNAEGLQHLLLAARTGVALRVYSSPATRAADIAAGVTRPADVIIGDVLENGFRFVTEAHAMPEGAWLNRVLFTSGSADPPTMDAARIVELRLEEVEVHHVDLDLGYDFSDTPTEVSDQLIRNFAGRRAAQGVPLNIALDDAPTLLSSESSAPTVTGTAANLLAWLAGRSDAHLRADTVGGEAPVLPPLA